MSVADLGQLRKAAEEAAAVRQERDSLRAMLAASSATQADLQAQADWLQLDLEVHQGHVASLEDRVAQLQAEGAGLYLAKEAAEERALALEGELL